MKKVLINQTDYANIYGLYLDNGKPIAEVEVRLAGRDVGTYYYSLSGKYTRKQIKSFFAKAKTKS